MVGESILDEAVDAKETETEKKKVSDSKSEWMRERGAGCLLGRAFGVDEGQEKTEEALRLFSPRAMVEDYRGFYERKSKK